MPLKLLSLLGLLLVSTTLNAADFPPPANLVKQAGYPDPLKLRDGTKVTTAATWTTKAKPELKALFQHYMYGTYPSVKTVVTGKVVHEDGNAFGGLGTLREIEVNVGVDKCPPFYLLLVVPNLRPKAGAPIFVGLNFSGNHTLVDDPKIHITSAWVYPNSAGVVGNKATAAGRGKIKTVWPFEQILKAGYAVATVYNGDFDPDVKETRGGMRPFITPVTEGTLPGDFPSTTISWAWGIHRMIDYITTLPEIDKTRIAAIGHSRLGKTVLLATALDDRIAVAFPHQAGCGGTAPSRQDNPKVESVKRINTSFPHWFCDNFKFFNDDVTKLPFDQHSLLALCAPRPVLYTNATEDEWANPAGQFQMMKLASPVYKLLGVEGVGAETQPETGKLLDSRLGYWIRTGKHVMNPDDWTTFTKFADKWLK